MHITYILTLTISIFSLANAGSAHRRSGLNQNLHPYDVRDLLLQRHSDVAQLHRRVDPKQKADMQKTLGDIQAARYAKDWMLENQPKPAKSAKGPKPIDKVGEALRQKIQGGKV